MTTAEIAKLEDIGRATLAQRPEVYEGDADFGFSLKAMTPMLVILAFAGALLFVIA